MQQKHSWSDQTYTLINWRAYGAVISKLPAGKHKFVIKCCHHWMPNATRVKLYGASTDACQDCQGKDTTNHFLRCPNRSTWRKNFITNLHKHLMSTKMKERLRIKILRGAAAWVLLYLRQSWSWNAIWYNISVLMHAHAYYTGRQ